MKTRSLIVLAACTLFAMPAFSQTTPVQTTPVRPVKIHAKRKGMAVIPGVSEMKQATEALRIALPIYDGLRIRAEKLIHRAHAAMMVATTGTTTSPAAVATGKHGKPLKVDASGLPIVRSEGHDKTRYTPAQVAQSQANMNTALTAVQAALKALGGASSPASQDLTQAANDIKAGIAIHGG